MSIDDIEPSEPLKAYIGNEPEKKMQGTSFGSFMGKHKYPPLKRGLRDVASFMGIPEAELTPAVTDAIVSLMEEIDELRHELAHAHSHENIMSATQDSHAELPVLTRHALVRELKVMAARTQHSGSSCSFVYFRIRNMPVLKNSLGLLASEMALRGTAEVLITQLRLTDRIGTLGGDGFGIVLPLANEEDALEKVKALVQKVEEATILWNGLRLEIQIAYGIHTLQANEDELAILNESDKDLHRRFQS
jgi:diguanylate cyclase (GGDEF)-like protein